MSERHIISLRHLRSRMTHSPGGMRVLVAWMALSLMFVLTPCCDVAGMQNPAPLSGATSHHHASDAHNSVQVPDSDDPCAQWLDRSDAVPVKADDATLAVAKIAPTRLFVSFPAIAVPVFPIWRSFRLSASPPDPLYLRHARLIL